MLKRLSKAWKNRMKYFIDTEGYIYRSRMTSKVYERWNAGTAEWFTVSTALLATANLTPISSLRSTRECHRAWRQAGGRI